MSRREDVPADGAAISTPGFATVNWSEAIVPGTVLNSLVQSRLPLPALAPARETISVDLVNATGLSQSGTLNVRVQEAGINIQKEIMLPPNETRSVSLTPAEFEALTIFRPQLWWPLNKDEQFRYHLELEFVQDKQISDRVETRFGIREITSDCNTPDRSRQFLVNGRRIFLHGSNWIPEAMCRNSRERTEAELRYTRQAGVNFLRLWAGGVAESDGIHDGSPYVAENPMFYYEDSASPRGSRINGLCPEYGCPILPTVDCLREMMPESDLWPISKNVWDYLDGGGFHGMTGNFDHCVRQYGASTNLEECALKAQAFGGLA